jgi:putative zinc finger protein
MSRACAAWRGDVGAYLVGALDGDARPRVISHLETCAACRSDYDELVPVRGLLSQLAGPDAAPRAGGPGRAWGRPPGGAPLPALRPVRPGAARRWLAGAVIAVAAAMVAVLATAGPVSSGPTFGAYDRTTGVRGEAQLHAAPTGAEIDLSVAGLPPGERCVMLAVSGGGSDVAGTWNATYDGTARVTGTSAIPLKRLTSVRIESAGGRLLLAIPVRALGRGPGPPVPMR